MSQVKIAAIVEGDGEVEAVPVLIRRFADPTPEAIRGCKEWLSKQMPHGDAYDETLDQPALAALFDLNAAKASCPSFEKCHREISSLLQQVAAITPGFLLPGH